jgi:hypothetical protein
VVGTGDKRVIVWHNWRCSLERSERVRGFRLVRTVKRPRRYISRHLLLLLRPAFRYSAMRDAYVLRGVGRRVGPVLRPNRRATRPARHGFEGMDRRRTRVA